MDPACSHSFLTETLIGYTVQMTSKARMAFAESADLAALAKLASSNIKPDSERERVPVLTNLEQELVPREQLHHLLSGKGAVWNLADVYNGCEIDLTCWTLSLVYHLLLFKPNRFGLFQQPLLHNVGMLYRV